MGNTCFVLPCKSGGGGGCPCPYPSHYNTTDGTTDGTVLSVSTFNRYVASPGNYNSGGWDDHTLHPVTRNPNLIYQPNENILIDDLSTDFYATVYDADETTVLASANIQNINGNTSVTQDGITIEVSNFNASGDKYEGFIKTSIDLSTIIPNSGKVTIHLMHLNNSTNQSYEKTQTLFYDSQSNSASLSGVNISENTPYTKYLSGVQFYDTGSQFNISIADIDYLNGDSYPNSQVYINPTQYGISEFYLSGENGDITDWNNAWDDVDDSYSGIGTISADNFCRIGSSSISAHTIDWENGTDVTSTPTDILVNTWTQQSNELEEYFYDEVFRKTSTWDTWDSTQDLRTYDNQNQAQVICGILKVPDTDYSGYLPSPNPDYSNYSGNEYYRPFIDVTNNVRSYAYLDIEGFTLDDLINSRVELWFFIPGKWTSECYAHTDEVFNFATFNGDNDPIRVDDSTDDVIHISFGTLGLDSDHNEIQMRLVINDSTINPSKIVMRWS